MTDPVGSQIEACCEILLEDVEGFRSTFETWTKDDQVRFKSWPIWRLAKTKNLPDGKQSPVANWNEIREIAEATRKNEK